MDFGVSNDPFVKRAVEFDIRMTVEILTEQTHKYLAQVFLLNPLPLSIFDNNDDAMAVIINVCCSIVICSNYFGY